MTEVVLEGAEQTKAPMDVARELVDRTRRKKELEVELAGVKSDIEGLQSQVLDLIEAEQLPESFKIAGATTFTREELWASPKDGDHEGLTEVLRDLGLVEYLPSKVNSQSISAYVRGYYDKETGEFNEDLDPRLLDALKVTRTTKVVVTG